MKKHKKLALSILNKIDIHDMDFHSGECVYIRCLQTRKNQVLLDILEDYLESELCFYPEIDAVGNINIIDFADLAFQIADKYEGGEFK